MRLATGYDKNPQNTTGTPCQIRAKAFMSRLRIPAGPIEPSPPAELLPTAIMSDNLSRSGGEYPVADMLGAGAVRRGNRRAAQGAGLTAR